MFLPQEAKNRPNIPLQEKFHRGISRRLRSIAEAPEKNGIKFLL
jgi:hypothetical protein